MSGSSTLVSGLLTSGRRSEPGLVAAAHSVTQTNAVTDARAKESRVAHHSGSNETRTTRDTSTRETDATEASSAETSATEPSSAETSATETGSSEASATETSTTISGSGKPCCAEATCT